MTENIKSFIEKLKETEFYHSIAGEKLYFLPEHSDVVYFTPVRAYTSTEWMSVSMLAEDYDAICRETIVLDAEQFDALLEV